MFFQQRGMSRGLLPYASATIPWRWRQLGGHDKFHLALPDEKSIFRSMIEPSASPIQPRIAVVEDENELRELIVDELNARGCNAVGLASAEALYRHMCVHALDIVVLDVGLPGEDGFAVASHLRQLTSVGIIMLTGRGGKEIVVQGLAEGADLFLVKPVDYDVLAAAVGNLHRRLAAQSSLPPSRRRGSPAHKWALSSGGWTLYGPDSKALALGSAERTVLMRLFERPGMPISRDELIEALTDQPWEFDPHRLDVLIHRLRGRVGNVFPEPLPLRAVRGVGYMLKL